MNNYLLFGNGWIGNKFKDYLKAPLSFADITNTTAVNEAIESNKPSVIINCAGKTGKPNIDWCEDHSLETFISNVQGPLTLANICRERDIHFVHISSGCIYTGDNNGQGYSETDTPNYFGSFYSRSKIMAEELLKSYSLLTLRLRMPVDKAPHGRNLITKLVKYQRVINVPNSLSMVDDFLYASKLLMEKERTGIYNIVNPGALGHVKILELYKEIVDPSYTFSLMSTEELRKITKSGRSNCILSTKKLESEGIILPPIENAIRDCLIHYKNY